MTKLVRQEDAIRAVVEYLNERDRLNGDGNRVVLNPTIADLMFKDVPIIESRPKGKWIDIVGTGWQCSNCKTIYPDRLTHKAHNYCTVCGAEMESE